jgi:hypothetical protein
MSQQRVFWLLLALNALFHLLFLPASFAGALTVVAESTAFWIVFSSTRRQLRRATLLWLALPYVFFLPTWLEPVLGALMSLLLALSFAAAWRHSGEHGGPPEAPDWREVAAFVAIVVWVNLSGVGGYGYQSPDWRLHNARLLELIEHPWPVRYDTDANLVYYVGWYLPSAALGKLAGHEAAARSLLPWTLFGVTLAVRWLCRLTGYRPSVVLVLTFALFGPQDVLGVLHNAVADRSADLPLAEWSFWLRSDDLDFWASRRLPFFLGSFVSNTFQLYWAPHQIVAGWLLGALAMQTLRDHRIGLLVLGYALLCLWTPLIMLGLFPLVLGVTLLEARRIRELLEIPSLFAVLGLTPLFLAYYAGGSALRNPQRWTLAHLEGGDWLVFLLFHLWTWGLYLASAWPALRSGSTQQRTYAGLLAANFILLSLVVYGLWSDLICRGAAPLSFCLLVVVLRAWSHYRETNRSWLLALLGVWMLLGSASALLQNRVALARYGAIREPVPSTQYDLFLGPDDSLFGRYLRREH